VEKPIHCLAPPSVHSPTHLYPSFLFVAEKLHEERKRGALLEERVREVEASLNSKDYEIQEKELEVEQLRYTSWRAPKYGKVVSLHREEVREAQTQEGLDVGDFVCSVSPPLNTVADECNAHVCHVTSGRPWTRSW
jgi:hypothetical protein